MTSKEFEKGKHYAYRQVINTLDEAREGYVNGETYAILTKMMTLLEKELTKDEAKE